MMTFRVEISDFNPTHCVFCRVPPPENQEKHTHQIGEHVPHVACNPCVKKYQEQAEANQSVPCPEECGYDFNPPKNCGERAFRWLKSGLSSRFARQLKTAIKNPVVIMISSGAAVLGLTLGIGSNRSLIVLSACAIPSAIKVIYDSTRQLESFGTPLFVGLVTPHIGNIAASLSPNGFNSLTGGGALVSGFVAALAVFKRSNELSQPISCRYAMVVNSLASLLFFGNALIAGAQVKVACAAAGSVFGFSGAIELALRRYT